MPCKAYSALGFHVLAHHIRVTQVLQATDCNVNQGAMEDKNEQKVTSLSLGTINSSGLNFNKYLVNALKWLRVGK